MNNYSGKTSFYNQIIDFEIKDCYLTLFIPGKIAKEIMFVDVGNGIKIMGKKQPLNVNQLTCFTNDGSKNIDCYFDPISYGSSSKNMFNGPSVLTIPLKRYIVYDLTKKDDRYYMIFYSKNIHKLTELIPTLRSDYNDDKKYVIDCDFPSLKLISKIKIDGYEIEIKPTYKYICKGPAMDFTPGIKITFDKTIKNPDIEKFYIALIRFIQYSSMRTNIVPDSFVISNGACIGEIFSYFRLPDSDSENLNDVYRDAFSWNVLYKKAGELYSLIYNNSVHLLNIQENRKFRLLVTFESISKDAAAFECEFDNLYPNGIPYNEERKQLEDEVVKELSVLMNNSSGKKKKIYKDFVKNVHKVSLGDKIEYALNKFSDGLKNIRENFKITYTNVEIGEFCRSIRNDVDHGNKIDEITRDVALSYIMLRCLIYVMQLKKAGYDFEDINILVNCLYSIQGAPR